MKIDPRMKVREVAGEHIIITQDGQHADLSQVIGLNSTALHIYQAMQGREFEVDDVVALLRNDYEVDADTARHDAHRLVEEMRELHILTD